ncbi:serine hydrolase domain-containing protein [Streptomyces sp. NPDC046915]|uniref:serine hydrolase domain-containing protein n=1 Tax=Streptomyces sp. NPDC046915 TaxID=3155257 RepID=UPI0033C5C395
MTPAGPLGRALTAFASAAPQGTGLAVAALTPQGSTILCRGWTDASRRRPVTEHTGFEIGSVTKTFTALLLAELSARDEVHPRGTLATHLPPAALPRGPHSHSITLEHLATHTSGLPRLPPGFLRAALPHWFTNPYRDFPPQALLPALSRTRVRRRPGTRNCYSNFGMGLLGHILERATATPYSALLRTRLLQPLGLTDTTAAPGTGHAVGHRNGTPLEPWLIPALPAAGALRCSIRDLLHYLDALLEPDRAAPHDTPLRTALHEVLAPRPTAPGTPPLCLAWTHRTLPTHTVWFHSGGTRGFTAFTGLTTDPPTALAAVTNTGPTIRGTFIQTAYDLLRHLIRTGHRA